MEKQNKDGKPSKPRIKPSPPVKQQTGTKIDLQDIAASIALAISGKAKKGEEPKTAWKDVVKIVAAANGENNKESKGWVNDLLICSYTDTWQSCFEFYLKMLKNGIAHMQEGSAGWHQANLNYQWWVEAGVETFIKKWGANAKPTDNANDTVPSYHIDRYQNEYDGPYVTTSSPPSVIISEED